MSISNHVGGKDPHLRAYGVGMRKGDRGRRSPTMIGQGDVCAPLLVDAAPLPTAYPGVLGAELPREPPPSRGMRLASFFCCAGGIDLGFRSAGFEPAFANDLDRDAVAAYAANLGHAPVHRDVRQVTAADWGPGPYDVVTGGFPCVTFSMAGRRAGIVDDLNGKLYLELCRAISEIRPRYFVAENVRGMLSANGGKAIGLVLAAFLRLGYRAEYRLVNMAEHGVPQTRERVIFVGVRLDQWRGSFRFPPRTRRLEGDARADRSLPLARTLREAVGDLPPPGERLLGVMHGDAAAKRDSGQAGVSAYQSSRPPRAAAPSHSQTTAPNYLIVGGHEANEAPVSAAHSMSKRVARGGRPSPTAVSEAANVQPFLDEGEVVAARNPDFFNPLRSAALPGPPMTAGGAAEDLGRGGRLRRMTVRECARVQSFPDWYEFPASQAAGYKLVGNAVPPLYAKRLAEAILEYDAREVFA